MSKTAKGVSDLECATQDPEYSKEIEEDDSKEALKVDINKDVKGLDLKEPSFQLLAGF